MNNSLLRSILFKQIQRQTLRSRTQCRKLINYPTTVTTSICSTPPISPIKSLNTRLFANQSTSSTTDLIDSFDVVINGKTIHYEKCGTGSHVLLLMPGAIGTGQSDFYYQLNGLDRTKFTIIAWDPPGYGQSRPPDRDFDDYYRKDAELAAKLMEVCFFYEFLFTKLKFVFKFSSDIKL